MYLKGGASGLTRRITPGRCLHGKDVCLEGGDAGGGQERGQRMTGERGRRAVVGGIKDGQRGWRGVRWAEWVGRGPAQQALAIPAVMESTGSPLESPGRGAPGPGEWLLGKEGGERVSEEAQPSVSLTLTAERGRGASGDLC